MTVIMDLGDFIPEEYTLSLSVNGSAYKFAYGEATVDDVLRMIAEQSVEGAEIIDRRRVIVTTFLLKHLVSGDKATFAQDLKLIPYQSQRESLDIHTIYETLLGRLKKNSSAGVKVERIPVQAG